MVTHTDIINRNGVINLAAKLGVERINVYQWRKINSIPAAYWQELHDQSLSTLEELAAAAAQKREAVRQTA